MDTSDIYYSDSSQLIDDNNSEWIGNTVLIDNHDLTWQEDGPEITVDYSESATDVNKTLTENDGYLTADNEDSTNDASQYFSILESNCDEDSDYSTPTSKPNCYVKVAVDKEEIILPDITRNEIEDEGAESDLNISDNDQVILYQMEGSDDLYAVQLADDGNGNFQKYKYRVRQNADGQFEAIPGSIEIQKADQNILFPPVQESEQEQEQETEEDLQPKDQKPSADQLALINQQISDNVAASEIESNFYMNTFDTINPEDYLLQNSYDQDTEEEYQTVEGVHVTGDSELSPESSEHIEETEFVNTDIYHGDDSESEYEIEELEDAFQDENINEEEGEEGELIHHENSQILQKSNIANVNSDKDKTTDSRNLIFKDDKNVSYLVVKAKEKENVSLIRPTHLRSILKNNCPIKPKNSAPKIDKPAIISAVPKPNKETSPANSIALKSARQPRKQTIKPVDRDDSEIIVQPVVYSLTGDPQFLPPPRGKKRIIDEIFQVSDESDPEFSIKPKKKIKKNKYGKRGRPRNVEITILDSEDEYEEEEETRSDISVIEVTDQESSNEETNENNNEQSKPESTEENNSDDKDDCSIVEEYKTNEATEEPQPPEEKSLPKKVGNKNNKCPYCPKTFPRLITLKKHMNIHSTRRSLRSKTNNSESESKSEVKIDKSETEPSDSVPKPRSFNCLKCKLKFLTENQYKRHQTIHLIKTSANKKQLSPIKKPEKKILISQKHIRNKSENNIKSQRLSQLKKSVVDKAKEMFKCEYCGQVFGTRTLLIVHRNSHKTFPCPNCKTTFTAKLLLDDHLRKNCVKPSPKKIKAIKKFSPKKINSKCDICQQVFPTVKSLQIHKNITHKPKLRINQQTEETKKPTLVKTKGAHGGVPMSLKMQQALSKFNVKS